MITIGTLMIVGMAAVLVLAINRLGGATNEDIYALAPVEDPPPRQPAGRRAGVVTQRKATTPPPTEMEARGPPGPIRRQRRREARDRRAERGSQ